jgi:hypothetical protein
VAAVTTAVRAMGVSFFLKLGDGESVLLWSFGSSKTMSSFSLVSSISS